MTMYISVLLVLALVLFSSATDLFSKNQEERDLRKFQKAHESLLCAFLILLTILATVTIDFSFWQEDAPYKFSFFHALKAFKEMIKMASSLVLPLFITDCLYKLVKM